MTAPTPDLPDGGDALLDWADLAQSFGVAIAVLLGLIVFVFLLSRFLYICGPHEILVFSGRKHKMPDGSMVGFKVIHGGRAFRIPLFEEISRMDVRLYGVEVAVTNAFSRGGIPLTVHAIANVKICTDPKTVHQAVERFLGVPTPQVLMVAKQTLEGVLREVLSQLTPEEVNEDRLKFAESLVKNAKDDFDKLGLELDVLKVQNVADDQKYLQNLGRARIAGMLRDGQNAENQSEQAVREEQAKARQRAESAQQQAESLVLQKRNMFRAEIAKLEAEAMGVENEAQVAAETARATAEQELQGLRAELAKLSLQVEMVLPAEANALAQAAKARGDAAPTAENGKATAEALSLLLAEWVAAGPQAKEIYVLTQLEAVVSAAVRRVQQMEITELEVVDGGDGNSLATVASGFSLSVSRVLEETGRAMGIDVRALVAGTSTDLSPNTLRGGAR
ncbi:MAG TPA: SPFH domain-containing protein [Polyangiaceae bacterium]